MYTLGDIARKGATLFPDRVALVFEGRNFTYGELDQRVNRLANALLSLGHVKGERLTILGENTYKYMEVYLAAAKAGLSVTPLNFRLSDRELLHIANDSEAVTLFVADGYEQRAAALRGSLPNIRTWISLDNPAQGFLDYEPLLAQAESSDPARDQDEEELALLMYTGGTTGLPKGVMLSHRNIMTAAYGLILNYAFTRHDVECYFLPLFHISLWPILCLMMVGGKVVILRRAELKEILGAIQREKCTHTNLVPTLLTWMLDLPELDDYDLSSLRGINYAGSPLSPEVLKRCVRKFGNIFTQGYGLTEAAPLVCCLSEEDHCLEGPRARLLASVGKEGPTVRVSVFDEYDQPVNPGRVGEIVAQGKNIMKGYWRQPDLTRQTLRGGWLHTGDLGTVDEDGYIYLVDRKADMIISGGENVYPKEVEDALYEHPAVQECVVVSAPDQKWGERVQAVVVPKRGAALEAGELIAHCRERLAGYKCPKSIEFWEEIPKTVVGKILRRKVKKHFWKDQARMIN